MWNQTPHPRWNIHTKGTKLYSWRYRHEETNPALEPSFLWQCTGSLSFFLSNHYFTQHPFFIWRFLVCVCVFCIHHGRTLFGFWWIRLYEYSSLIVFILFFCLIFMLWWRLLSCQCLSASPPSFPSSVISVMMTLGEENPGSPLVLKVHTPRARP